MPPPPPRNTSSTKLSEKSSTSGRHRQKRAATGAGEVAPATPSSFLNLTLQHSDAQQGGHGHVESTVTFDSHASTDTSPATVKSASSTPTFGPTHVSGSMGSPSFISIPASYDPNSMVTTPTLSATSGNRRPQLKQNSCTQSRSTSSSPAFKPMISPNLKPLLPGGLPPHILVTDAQERPRRLPIRWPQSQIIRTFLKANIINLGYRIRKSYPAGLNRVVPVTKLLNRHAA